MEHYKDDAGVVFGDVNLREGRVTQSRDGTPQNPGAGGWPTPQRGHGPRRRTPLQSGSRPKDLRRVQDPATDDRRVHTSRICDAARPCDDDEAPTWTPSRDAAARDRRAARLDDLLSDATQKKMKAERKLLAKLAVEHGEVTRTRGRCAPGTARPTFRRARGDAHYHDMVGPTWLGRRRAALLSSGSCSLRKCARARWRGERLDGVAGPRARTRRQCFSRERPRGSGDDLVSRWSFRRTLSPRADLLSRRATTYRFYRAKRQLLCIIDWAA